MTGRVFGWLGIRNGVGLVETGTDGSSRSVDVMAIDCLGELGDIADLGLTLAQGKQLVALVQQEIVTSRDHAARLCRSCGARSRITALTRSPLCSVRYVPTATFSQCQVRRGRGWSRLTGALQIDPRTRLAQAVESS